MNTVKTFISPSRGMGMRCCSDRIAVAPDRGRFAVADGVSSSHLPGLWAGLVGLDFITERDPADRWAEGLDEERRMVLRELWEEDCDETERNADPAGARRLRRTRSFYGHGASTLAGITIGGGELSYCIIGDSCLWVRDAGGQTKCLPEGVRFSNLTEAVSSASTSLPEAVSGRMSLREGVLILATDALSDWIGRMEENGGDPVGLLEELSSREEFEALVRRYRETDGPERLNDDDVAAVVIRIGNPASLEWAVSRYDPAGRLDAPLEESSRADNR